MTTPSPTVNRRYFLRAAGITLALPLLESLSSRVLGAGLGVASKPGAAIGAARPQRLVAIGNMLGFYQPEFFPTATGRDFALPSLLQPLAAHRPDFSLFSGLDHGLKGGHFAIHSYLSGVRSMDAKSMPEGNISVDQRAAETIGGATRFSALTIGSEDGLHGGCQMCWTRSGTRVPPIPGPKELFRKLFISDGAHDLARSADSDGYEADRPKPAPGMPEPANTGFVSDLPVLYDLIALALQTDSTRIATLEIAGGFDASALGLRKDYHALSHHGQVQENINGLLQLEKYQMAQFARFLAKLKSLEDGQGHLLDHTMVLFGSGMGNANAHTNSNLPIILAGGGFKHGEHRAYPASGAGRVPLANLYLTLLQRFGVETNRFALSTGTLRGLDLA